VAITAAVYIISETVKLILLSVSSDISDLAFNFVNNSVLIGLKSSFLSTTIYLTVS